jgi:hypothetical protein
MHRAHQRAIMKSSLDLEAAACYTSFSRSRATYRFPPDTENLTYEFTHAQAARNAEYPGYKLLDRR